MEAFKSVVISTPPVSAATATSSSNISSGSGSSRSTNLGGLHIATLDDIEQITKDAAEAAARPPKGRPRGTPKPAAQQPSSAAKVGEGDVEKEENIMLDWKGDPIKFNAGDRLPGFK